jgi:hypothetical protein
MIADAELVSPIAWTFWPFTWPKSADSVFDFWLVLGLTRPYPKPQEIIITADLERGEGWEITDCL